MVLIIVALELGAEASCMAVMDSGRLCAFENFTHNPGPAFLADMIQDDIGAEVILVGVQPEATAFAAELSNSVHRTLDSLEEMLESIV